MPRKRYSVAKERIRELGKSVGVNYSDKTYINIKNFLERYTSLKGNHLKANNDDAVKLWQQAPQLFDAMIGKAPVSREITDNFVTSFLNYGKCQDIIDYSLERVRMFSDEGDLYCKLLNKLYFNSEIQKDKEVEKSIALSHGTYYIKKKYAIMLFGIVFWSRILRHWRNAKEEMRDIELSHGRDGSLSQNLSELFIFPSLR